MFCLLTKEQINSKVMKRASNTYSQRRLWNTYSGHMKAIRKNKVRVPEGSKSKRKTQERQANLAEMCVCRGGRRRREEDV